MFHNIDAPRVSYAESHIGRQIQDHDLFKIITVNYVHTSRVLLESVLFVIAAKDPLTLALATPKNPFLDERYRMQVLPTR